MPEKTKSKGLSCAAPGCEEVRCATKASLRRHQKDQHPEDPAALICPTCSLGGFTGTRQVQRHLKQKHSPVTAVCVPCQLSFPDRKSLKRHRRSVHPSDPSELDCFICGTHHASIEARQKHEKASQHKTNISQGMVKQKLFPCRSCSAPFASPTLCHRHFQDVHRHRRVWDCPHCQGSFTSKSAQREHERNFHAPLYDRICSVCTVELKTCSKREVHEKTCRGPRISQVVRSQAKKQKKKKKQQVSQREASPRRAETPNFEVTTEPAVTFDKTDSLYNSQMFSQEQAQQLEVFRQYHAMMRVALADAAVGVYKDDFKFSPEPAEQFQRILVKRIKEHLLTDREASRLPQALDSFTEINDFHWLAQVVCFAYRVLKYEKDVNPGSDLIRLTFSNPLLSELDGTSPQIVCRPMACRKVLIMRLAFWPYLTLLRTARDLANCWHELLPDENESKSFVRSFHKPQRTSPHFIHWVNALRLVGCDVLTN